MSLTMRLPLLGQPDPDQAKDVHLVGRYALGITWADSHGSIYPFEPLRRACPCGACEALGELAPLMAWPASVRREAALLAVVWSDGHASRYAYRDLRAGCRCAGCTGGH